MSRPPQGWMGKSEIRKKGFVGVCKCEAHFANLPKPFEY